MGKRYYIILGILVLLFILVNANTPEVVNWKPTFRKKDKNPYGAEVTYAFLEDIFGNGNVAHSNASPYDYLHANSKEFNIIYVAQAIQTSDPDMEAILEFAEKGNNIFIAAEYVIGPLADTLGIAEIYYHQPPFSYQDSVTLSFTNKNFERKEYVFGHDNIQNYLIPDTTHKKEFVILSESSDYQVHYVKIPWGKGNIFYHTNPMLFTNYNMLFAANQHKYISNCFSYLPKQKTVWSEFYSKGNSQDQESKTELRYILKNPRLRWAWLILLAFIFVYMIFQSRRRQRAIPIVKPPKNSTLEFVETTGRLYFQQHNHGNLAMKKITFFLEKVRNKYYISTSVLDEPFIETLASKSGVPQEEIRILVKYFEAVKKAGSISESQLLDLNKKIESFYTKASL